MNRKIKNIATFFHVERTLETSGLLFHGLNLWAFLRNYYSEKYILSNDPGSKPSLSLAINGLKALFYGFTNLFRSYDYIAVIASNQRKKIGDQFVHPFDYLPQEILNKTLIIEMPVSNAHYPIKNLPHKKVISRFLLVFLEFILIKISSNKKYEPYKASIEKIEEEIDVKLNYNYLFKRFFAGYNVMQFFIKRYKPKAFFCTVAYPIMNYVLACKEKAIPVIEMQHGYIGKTHRAYNINTNMGTLPYPDYFLSWGNYECDFLGDDNSHYISKKHVYPVGNFYIEHILKQEDELKHKYNGQLKKFSRIVAVSMQDPLEDTIIPFIHQLSSLDPNIGFLILPRSKQASYYSKQYKLNDNIFFIEEINTYQGILLADVHTTMWSTTAIEALALGKANILINPNNLAHEVFGHFLNATNYTYYAETPTSFLETMDTINNLSQGLLKEKSKYFFKEHFEKNMRNATLAILKKEKL